MYQFPASRQRSEPLTLFVVFFYGAALPSRTSRRLHRSRLHQDDIVGEPVYLLECTVISSVELHDEVGLMQPLKLHERLLQPLGRFLREDSYSADPASDEGCVHGPVPGGDRSAQLVRV